MDVSSTTFFHVADHDIAQADPPGLSSLIRAGEEDSVTPIHMFYREWAVIVEIERHPQTAMRLHAAEQSLMSDDAQVRDAARSRRDRPPRTRQWQVSEWRWEHQVCARRPGAVSWSLTSPTSAASGW